MDPITVAAAINLVRELLTAGREVSGMIAEAMANGQDTISREQVDQLFSENSTELANLRAAIAARKAAEGGTPGV